MLGSALAVLVEAPGKPVLADEPEGLEQEGDLREPGDVGGGHHGGLALPLAQRVARLLQQLVRRRPRPLRLAAGACRPRGVNQPGHLSLAAAWCTLHATCCMLLA